MALQHAQQGVRDAEAAAKSRPDPPRLIPNVHVQAEDLLRALTTQGGPLPLAVQAAVEAMQDTLRKAAGDEPDQDMPQGTEEPAAPPAQEERKPRTAWAKGKAKGSERDHPEERTRSRSRSAERGREEAALLEELEGGEDASDTEFAQVRKFRHRRQAA